MLLAVPTAAEQMKRLCYTNQNELVLLFKSVPDLLLKSCFEAVVLLQGAKKFLLTCALPEG